VTKPLAIDLFAGLGGWTEGLLAEGWDVVGFDIERHVYGNARYPAQLVLQDVLTLDGRQFRGHASLIVASPPCQEYSYMAMPWKRAKQIARALRDDMVPFPPGYKGSLVIRELTQLFDACFRIASEAQCPLVVENVKGAEPWVGRAKAHFGSFYLWGDVAQVGRRITAGPPQFGQTVRATGGRKFNPDGTNHPQGSWFAISNSENRGSRSEDSGTKCPGIDWNGYGEPGYKAEAFNTTNAQRYRAEHDGRKVPVNFHEHEQTGKPGRSFQSAAVEYTSFGWHKDSPLRRTGSHSLARKAASAKIAKIPPPLARYIARAFMPR
jgi:C-5 cytosine-specific DNA methylase